MIHPPGLCSLLFRDVIFRVSTREKKLYLTFDDGPTQHITNQILNMLQAYQAKATFFVCGKNAETHPQMCQQIIESGHTIGNHTYQHMNGWKTATHDYLADTERAQQIVQSAFFRPPYGKLNWTQYRYLRKHYQIVLWDIMCMDFDQKISPETCFENVKKYARPGSVIVFHDSEKAATNMLYALEQTLIKYSKEGYTFARLT